MWTELVVAILATATVNTVVMALLQRHLQRAQVAAATADALQRYQVVINDLWKRIHELEERARRLADELHLLEDEVEQLRQLVAAYERTYGRQFAILEGRIVRIDAGGAR